MNCYLQNFLSFLKEIFRLVNDQSDYCATSQSYETGVSNNTWIHAGRRGFLS